MHRVRHSTFVRSFLLPMVLLTWLSACHKWSSVEPPFARVLTEKHHDKVRITLKDKRRFVVYAPTLSLDSLAGVSEWNPGGSTYWWEREPDFLPIAFAVTDLERLEVRKADWAANGALVLLVLVTLTVAASVAVCGDLFSPAGCMSPP